MQWFVANMWMALAVATILGLLFGFSFRGLLSTNRVRRATVEREIAKTELTQAKAEIEELYLAQRKRKEESAQAVGGDDTLRAELDERETRISSLGDELTAAREELERLKTESSGSNNIIENVGAAAAGAVAGVVLSGDDEKELTELRDRNTWLEERVSGLEADVSAAQTAAAQAAEAVVAPIAAPEADSTTGPEFEKLNWQSAYLRQRVDSLESKLIATSAAAPAVVEQAAAEPVASIVAAVADPEADEAETAAADEELARLRWRNRYLEGRLAYFEEGDEAGAGEDGEQDLAAPAAIVETETEPEPEPEVEAEPETEQVAEPEPAEEPAPEVAAAPEADVHPSEAMLAELEGVQPEQIDKPGEGGDDLTAITGIGPRIAEVLNGLGIWTYSQIAGWAPEHETWIENHLAFKGRVSRENWVGQASELMATA